MSLAVVFWIGASFGVGVGFILAGLMREAKRDDRYIPMAERCEYWNARAFQTGKAPCGHGLCGAGS